MDEQQAGGITAADAWGRYQTAIDTVAGVVRSVRGVGDVVSTSAGTVRTEAMTAFVHIRSAMLAALIEEREAYVEWARVAAAPDLFDKDHDRAAKEEIARIGGGPHVVPPAPKSPKRKKPGKH